MRRLAARPLLLAAFLLALAFVARLTLTALPGGGPVASASSDTCVTTDTDLLAQVEAKVTRHATETGRTDLHEMFSRSLATMKGTDTYTTADIKARPDKQGANWQGAGSNPLWQAIYAELDRLETCREAQAVPEDNPTPTPTPVVSIAGGSAVTEGGTATFTLTASPAPQSSLTVSLSVSQSGNYAASGTTGTKTVTLPTSGSATYSVATVDDTTDEANGSVSVAVSSGNGYTVGSTSSATVNVADNDAPTVSIAGGSGVTEGGTATFTLTASPAPQSSLTVSLTVSQSGDYAASGTTGTKTVTLPTSGSATYSVATVDDTTDEADGSVSVAVSSGNGYSVGSPASATVSVADNDNAPVQPDTEQPDTEQPDTEQPDTEQPDTEQPDTEQPAANVDAPAPTENTVEILPNGDVLFGWPGAQSQPNYLFRVVSYDGHGQRTVRDYTKNWYVFDDLQAGRWLFMVYDMVARRRIGDWITLAVPEKPAAQDTTDTQPVQNDPPPTPVVSITAGSGVTEGGTATFTVTASPAPQSSLTVSLTVSQSGDYAASGTTGTKTVTLPTGGSATYSVATVDDTTDEADGSVSVAISSGNGYSVGSTASATVNVADNDDAPVQPVVIPTVSITAGSGVTEGGTATFTVSASPAPQSSLTVSLTVSQSGDYAASGTTGTKTVTIPTSGSATYSVATVNDTTDEANGSVSVAISSGNGYTVGSTSSASVSVSDNDDAPVQPVVIPTVSITAGSGVTEGGTATFTLTASPAPTADLPVSLTVSQSGDYAASGTTGTKTVTIPTSGSVTYDVATVDDTTDEADGSVSVAVSSGNGYTVGSTSSASVNVSDNDDAPPAAWWAPILSAAEPPKHAVSLLTPKGNDVLFGWPTKEDYTHYNLRARHMSGQVADDVKERAIDVSNYEGNWYVFEDLNPGRWLVEVRDSNGWWHGGNFYVDVPADGKRGGGSVSEVTIDATDSAKNGIAEGEGATFILRANPAPQTPLAVKVSISQSGDYAEAGSTGTKTVTIPARGFAFHRVNTVDDTTKENDGSIRASLIKDPAYVVTALSQAGSIRVSDNDTPEVSVSAGPGTIEGGTVTFTLTASKVSLSQPLPVNITVGQNGYFGAPGVIGSKTVNIPTSGSLTHTVATVDDERDEADGHIVLVVEAGKEYDLSATASVALAPVHDNDPAGTGPTCLTTDTDLLTSVTREQDANSRNKELSLMLGRAYNTMKGKDSYTTVHIKRQKSGEDDWQGSGKDALWQSIYTELDRLEVCRGPQVVQFVDNSPSTSQLNSGQSATITSSSHIRDHDNDSSTPTGIVEGERACFTVTLNPPPSDWQRVKFSVYEGLASDSGIEISRSGGWDYIAYGHTGVAYHGIPTSGTRDICIPTVNDRTDEKDAQIWMQVSDDVGGTGWHRINVYDDDEPAPAADANLNDNDPTNDVYGPKRIPWAQGWTHAFHTGNRAMPGPEGNRFRMSMYWGIPEYYRQADVRANKDRAGEGRYKGWWGPSVTYCIQIIKAEQGWNYDRPGSVPNIEMTVVGEGPINGVRCIGSVWLPTTRATDRWDNGGAGESWWVATGGATYTFGIWVQGDKADSYREFKHTVRNPGGCINVHDSLSRAFRSEYVCDTSNPAPAPRTVAPPRRPGSLTQSAPAPLTAAPPQRPGRLLGAMDIPAEASHQNGRGIITGWVCAADTVTIELAPADGAPSSFAAATGPAPPDTTATCGGPATGFSLPLNWNTLGDGPHTVRVLVDDVLLSERSVTVTTLGAPVRPGLSGRYTLPDFPQAGGSTPIAWNATLQQFVLADGPAPHSATDRSGEPGIAWLDTPASGSWQSGQGVISGWACAAETVEVILTPAQGPAVRLPVATGSARADTLDICGETATGFGRALDWATLGAGVHTVELLVDGTVVAQSTVRVSTLAGPVGADASGPYAVEGFPAPEERVTLTWQAATQSFVITAWQ